MFSPRLRSMNAPLAILLFLLSSMTVAQPTLGVPVSGGAQRVFIAPQGDDRWSGLTEQAVPSIGQGPVRTWPAAQRIVRDLLRAMREGRLTRQPVNLTFLPGDYHLEQEMTLLPEDSGEPGAPLVLQARIPGTVRLIGGKQLTELKRLGGIARFTPPAELWNAADGGQLFIDGRRATLARHPNAGDFWLVQPTQAPTDAGSIRPPPAAVSWLSQLQPEELARARVHLYQSWTSGRHAIRPSADGELWALRPAALWKSLRFGPNQRFYVENIAKALDQPGEWIGMPGEIHYLPEQAQSGQPINAILATLPRILVSQSGPDSTQRVHDIELRGLHFDITSLPIPSGGPSPGMTDMQAGVAVGAAIELNDAERIQIADCHLSHTGGYAVWLRRNVRDSRVSRTTFTDLGAGAIKVGEPKQTSAEPPATGNNRLDNNVIRRTGQLVPGAVGIWIGPSWDNVVAQNLIVDTTYTAISVGWRWGYGNPTSGRNKVVGNLLHRIGSGTLSDLAGIYTLGISPGTELTHNLIREVRGFKGYGPVDGGGAWGIYNDEGSSELLVRQNIVIGTESGGYHLNYGRSNRIVGNLFAGGDRVEVRISGGDPQAVSLTLTHNLILPTRWPAFEGHYSLRNVVFEANWIGRAAATESRAPPLSGCLQRCTVQNLQAVAGANWRLISLEGDGSLPTEAPDWVSIAAKAGPSHLGNDRLNDLQPAR
jgi:hypothetical protein